ncbi:hypothetical protein DPD56_26675 [Salmonella enterica subsp. diarizonae]|nr:hypothetical protein [Salmonella enterica subsp. enterica serovar Enteritidis]ECC9068135.1 hypothetical protein [Salmonella enterica subsp. diarizonae]
MLTRPAGLPNPSPVQKQVLNRLTVFIDVNKRKYERGNYTYLIISLFHYFVISLFHYDVMFLFQ